MIYSDELLEHKIKEMIKFDKKELENEVVEFKEARTNYSFNDIGKYFSALGNEANLRSHREAWLIFGIKNDTREIVGTEYRKSGNLQSLKREIADKTNERLTFFEIYELTAAEYVKFGKLENDDERREFVRHFALSPATYIEKENRELFDECYIYGIGNEKCVAFIKAFCDKN